MADRATDAPGPLARELDAFNEALLGRAESRMAAALRRLQAGSLGDAEVHRLRVGQIAPDFTLPDQAGNPVSLSAALARGPVMLTFFRGGWCPFCTISLRAFVRLHEALEREGVSLLAISPQGVAQNAETASASRLRFPVLADYANAVAERYGLIWKLDAEMRDLYQRLGHDIPALNGTETWELPIPASFVLQSDGRVVFAHVDPRVTKRVEPDDALAAVQALRSTPACGGDDRDQRAASSPINSVEAAPPAVPAP